MEREISESESDFQKGILDEINCIELVIPVTNQEMEKQSEIYIRISILSMRLIVILHMLFPFFSDSKDKIHNFV